MSESMKPYLEELLHDDDVPERYAEVFRYRIGLQGCEPHSRADTAAHFGITPERVRLIESRLIRRLGRLPARSRKLQSYID